MGDAPLRNVCQTMVPASLVELSTNVTSGAPAEICCGCKAGSIDMTT